MPFFIFYARITPKYFKDDVDQGIWGLWLGPRGMRDDGFYMPSVGFVTERLRFVYTYAPKTLQTHHQAQTWCSAQAAAQQMLLPTPGQSWQHRAFFAHAPVLPGIMLAFLRPSAAKMRHPVERLHTGRKTPMVVL
ncbi:hypothetical protein [Pseudomonas syringae]|uniref:hypothetical protein n=1 Tax=Pseudomonas syringae TaxID=317 RepID=UPI001FD97627|nr:hypothetical protein [Pseudomonas syringae]